MIIQIVRVESSSNPSISSLNDAKFKELQLNRDDQPKIEVPDSGQESSIKVSKSPEPIELGGNLSSEDSLELSLIHI